MIALENCTHENHKKNGTRNGLQRYKCCDCGKRWTEKRPRPLGGMYLSIDRAEMIVRMLCEGCSIRVIERLTGAHRDTICDVLVTVGTNCRRFTAQKIQNVKVTDLQLDELWAFCGCKEKTAIANGYGNEMGDQYCYVGIDRTTKLIAAWHSGARDRHDTKRFIDKLRVAVDTSACQINSDGWWGYTRYVPITFKGVDYGQIIKIYASRVEHTKYSPAEIKEVKRKAIVGAPAEEDICTSHIERMNLTIRTQLRRFSRLTNGYSKKLLNHKAALGLFFAYYNFCRKHSTIKTTPAVAAKLTDHIWTVRELMIAAAPQI